MAMKFATGGGGEFKVCPAGSHIAVCDMVVDIGMQPGFEGRPTHKIYIRFQIPGERVEVERDGQAVDAPMVIGSFYTASMNEKANLRKHLEGWRGKAFTNAEAADFDVSTILGKPLMITVVHKQGADRTFANITGMSRLPKGIPTPALEGESLYYDDECGRDAYMKLPNWLKDKIEARFDDAPTMKPDSSQSEQFDDDDSIPF